MRYFLLLVCCAGQGLCNLWPQGVVHYAINKKDYDVHSQDTIMDTFTRLHNEICVKFFNTPTNYTATKEHKILYISNPDKRKDCPPNQYDFSGSVVDMPIGYKCLDSKNVARIAVEMLRASIEQTASTINSYDLIKKFQELAETVPRPTLLTPTDRNYLNAYYHHECGSLSAPSGRRFSDYFEEEEEKPGMSEENMKYYKGLLWPLGVVMYGVHPAIARNDPSLNIIKHAMATIELQSCVVFQPIAQGPNEELEAKNFLWFGLDGEEEPHLGFLRGNQSLKLHAMASGAPRHTAHSLNALLRTLGVSMMSNRHDRTNHLSVNWNNVQQGKEHYLERSPKAAWLEQIPYDFTSATHAPANYMCRECQPGAYTVVPLQDTLWQRTLSMGHRTDLSEADQKLLSLVYRKECQARFVDTKK